MSDISGIIASAEGEDPYFVLARLKQQAGLSDAQARRELRERGIRIDGSTIDPRVDTLEQRRDSGFVRYGH